MAKTVKITEPTWRKLERVLKEQDAGRTVVPPRFQHTGIVRVRNDSGVNVPQYGVLGVNDAVFDPAFHLEAFKRNVVLSGGLPDKDKHTAGRFVICAEPIPAGQIGKAFASGVCPVMISVGKEQHTYADITHNNALGLVSGTQGPCVILWKESGTGDKWAVIRFHPVSEIETDVQWVEVHTVSGNTILGFYRQYVPFGPTSTGHHWDVDYWGHSGFKEPWNIVHGKPLVWENESPPFWMNRPYYHNNGSDWCLYWQCNNGYTTDEPSLSSPDWSPFTVAVRPYPMRNREGMIYKDYEVGQVIPVTRVWSPTTNEWLVVALDDTLEDKTLSMYVAEEWPPGDTIFCTKNWSIAGAQSWSSGTTYRKTDIVYYSGSWYRSLRYNNVGVTPGSDLAKKGHFWTRVITFNVRYHCVGSKSGAILPELSIGDMLIGRRNKDTYIWTDQTFINAALFE